ncbi:hypothetical protein Tco_0856642 [Tanacetum coccineum]|uniref:Reverse transcriptase domain-containing protein n=1 Tax=Tanacetum coccineum TaxID=301880 RepID=A0ABQ5B3Y2_9ASTR
MPHSQSVSDIIPSLHLLLYLRIVILMDTAYGSRVIRRIGNWSNAFSYETQALIRRISFAGYGVLVKKSAIFKCLRSGYQQKDRKPSQNDKTEHGMEKTVQNQGQIPTQQIQGVSKTDFENYVKANDAVLRNMQNQGQGLQNQMTNLTEMLFKFVNSNTASSSVSLPSNTVTKPKEDLKGITTRSGTAYQGPMIPTSKEVERRTEVTKDTVFPTNNGITKDVQPPVVPTEKQNLVSEPDVAPVSAPMPNPKPSIPYPSRRNDESTVENAKNKKRSGYHQKDRKPSQNDKTEHGMEKTVQNQGQSPKMPKSESILKNTIECNLNPSDGPGKPNSIFMKTVKTKWALNHLQQTLAVHLT